MYYVIDVTDRWGVDSSVLFVCTSEETAKTLVKCYRDLQGSGLSSSAQKLKELAENLMLTTPELHTYLKDDWVMYYQKVNGY